MSIALVLTATEAMASQQEVAETLKAFETLSHETQEQLINLLQNCKHLYLEQRIELPTALHRESGTFVPTTSTERLNLVKTLSKICFDDMCYYYAETRQASIEELNNIRDYLEELFRELLAILLDPKKLAQILAEVAIVSPGLYLCWRMIMSLRNFSTAKKSSFGRKLVAKCEKILRYFETVPKSRITEISIATGMPTEEIKLFLQLMCFVHIPGCFWQPPISKAKPK